MPDLRDTPAVVVGSGVAGLSAALALAPIGVTVLTKTTGPAGGSSLHAQGGVAAALGPDDTPALHAADTVAAGAGLVDPDMARLLAAAGAERIRALLAAGFPADRDAQGRLLLGREAAHGRDRILHAGGDATGRALHAFLLGIAVRTPGITIVPDAVAVDLVVRGGHVRGVLTHGADGWTVHRTPRVVLATGGIGALFARTTNPPEVTGDGLAMAARAGARLADLEFIQFHPTVLDAGDDPAPLLTEALRGAGARLVDAEGRVFMAEEHPQADLAPRDVVARAVHSRRAAGKAVFLDVRPALAGGAGRFPTLLKTCAAAGLDPWSDLLPVVPAAHFHMGGIAADADGRSSVMGLWACGEAARTGVHGANRLASNSLLEGLVFGNRAGRDAAAAAAPTPDDGLPTDPPPVPVAAAAGRVTGIIADLRRLMQDHVGIERDAAGLAHAADRIDALTAAFAGLPAERRRRHDPAILRTWAEAGNRLTVAALIVRAAAARRRSSGAHRRTDEPPHPHHPDEGMPACRIP